MRYTRTLFPACGFQLLHADVVMAKASSHPSAIQTMTVNFFSFLFFAQNCFFGLKTTEIPLWKDAALYLLTNTAIFPTLLEIGVVLTRGRARVEGVGWYSKMCMRSITLVSQREALLVMSRVPGNGEVSVNKSLTLELPQNNPFHFISLRAQTRVGVCASASVYE